MLCRNLLHMCPAFMGIALAFSPAVNAAPNLPQGCLVTEDASNATLRMAGDASATITAYSCPIAEASGSTFLAYEITWQAERTEHFVYADPARPSEEGLVGVSFLRAGPSVIVIDQQEERGGIAVLVWRAGPNRYFVRQFRYAGTDEGQLQVQQNGDRVTAVFIEQLGRAANPIGATKRFRLVPSKGIEKYN
jgi:hypothetical protein